VSSSRYTQALEFLYARTTGGVRLGLDRTHALLKTLGDPHRVVPCFHVAGTNGKGSTVASIAGLLRHKGLRVATYTSPHLIDFRERIIVDGTPISEDEVVAFTTRHLESIERIGATFFEATTAMAFDHFAHTAPDVAVIETGLGGRLDSTNVVDPVAAVVTNIGMDHTDLLGTSLESIAREKAGIFKSGRAAVIGERWPDIRDLLEKVARDTGASPILSLSRDVTMSYPRITAEGTTFSAATGDEEIQATIGLIGSHQPHNAMTAWLALQAAGAPYAMPLATIEPALAGLTLPGRFHRVGSVIFDVAHNPAGASVVAGALSSLGLPRPLTILVGVLADKDWRAMIRTLAGVADEIVATLAPTAPAERRWHLEDVTRFAREYGLELRAIANFDEALHAVTTAGGTTVITGSFHTVGDAMARLQVNPLAR
jgi:dihydrofolate synthase/folylpolyglutamate synthase